MPRKPRDLSGFDYTADELHTPAPTTAPTPSAAAHTDGAGESTVNIYVHPSIIDAAKSAYLVDYDAGGPTSFARWVDQAIRDHLTRPLTERDAIAASVPTDLGRGRPRRFILPDATMSALDAMLALDRRDHGRIVSRSAAIVAAIHAATEKAREHHGGTLPPAPTRLPTAPLPR